MNNEHGSPTHHKRSFKDLVEAEKQTLPKKLFEKEESPFMF